MLRLVQVGLGPMGRRVLSDLVARGLAQVVAAVDHAPELHGRPLAELVPGAPARLRVLPELDRVPSWEGIEAALVTTSSHLESCSETLRSLCARGLAIASSCEQLLFPWLEHPKLAQELDQHARAGGSRLLGTGVNPGFLMDTLPLVLTTLCNSLRSVEVERFQDASQRRLPFQRKIGAGLEVAEFQEKAAAGQLGHVGLPESLHLIAHALGWELEHWNESVQPVLAETSLPCGWGPIAAGRVAGVRQVIEGRVSDQRRLRLVFQAAIGQSDPRERVLIDGDPNFEMTIPGGVNGDTATAAVLANVLPALIEATPGLHTMASLRSTRHAGGR